MASRTIERGSGGVGRDLLRGALAGVLASAAVAPVDAVLGQLVSNAQKRRERRVRKGSPHSLAGPRAGARLAGRKLSRKEERLARALFTTSYGIGWGMVYALVRRRFPAVSRGLGLPFAIPFFVACDGVIAPMLGLTPSLHRVPWQIDAKELANHGAWTAGAELLLRRTDAAS